MPFTIKNKSANITVKSVSGVFTAAPGSSVTLNNLGAAIGFDFSGTAGHYDDYKIRVYTKTGGVLTDSTTNYATIIIKQYL